MKISKYEFNRALTVLGKVLTKTSPVQEYRSVKIAAEHDNVLTLTGCSADQRVTVFLPAEGNSRFTGLVDYLELRSKIKGAGSIVIRSTDSGLLVESTSSGKQESSILFPVACSYPEPVEMPTDTATCPLPATFIPMLTSAASVISSTEPRLILRGINISNKGFTTTNGRELLHIPVPLHGLDAVTIPYPASLIATRSETAGEIAVWNHPDQGKMFRIMTPSCIWTGKALPGEYPNWQKIVPDTAKYPYSIKITPDDAENVLAFLRKLPDDLPGNAVTLDMPDAGHLRLGGSETLQLTVAAESKASWGDYSLAVSKEILMRLLQLGHTRVYCTDVHAPLLATEGIGNFIAMPLALPRKAVTIENKNTNKEEENQKETTTMEPITTTAAARTPDTDLNPLDELSNSIEAFKLKLKSIFDESALLARKVKEAQIAQKQKERDFIQAKRAIERIRMAI